MKFIVGKMYECIYDVDVYFVPLMVLPTLEEARRYYFTDGFFSSEFEELNYNDLVVFLEEPIEVQKNWGYAKVLTSSGFAGWLLVQENDFRDINQFDILKK